MQNKMQIWVPPGFAHGFYVLSEWAEIVYKTTEYYAPQWERALLWNDAQINVRWPLIEGLPLIISQRDTQGTPFNSAEVYD